MNTFFFLNLTIQQFHDDYYLHLNQKKEHSMMIIFSIKLRKQFEWFF